MFQVGKDMRNDEANEKRIFIKQFGLQRSGTNILKALIEINYPNSRVLTMYLGNKHEISTWESMAQSINTQNNVEFDLTEIERELIIKDIEERNLPILIQIKKPISWLDSYFRYQKKKIQYLDPEANPSFDLSWAARSLSLWEATVVSWLSLAKEYPDNCIIIEHMEMLEKPEEVLEKIACKFELIGSGKLISQINNAMKRGHYKVHGKDLIDPYHKFDPSYHTEKQWLQNYPEDVLSFAKKRVQQIIEENAFITKFGIDFTEL